MADHDLRDIYVNKFDEESAKKFRAQMLERAEQDPTCPIVIYIDSYGGYVDSLFTMLETMNEVPNPKITVCIGKAMSCGAALLSHGDMRFCGKLSRVMVHEITSGEVGDVHDNYASAAESKRLNRKLMGLIAKNCGMKGGYPTIRKIIKEQDGRDLWMDAHEALEFGLVDHVGLPKITPIVMYDVRPASDRKNYKTQKQPKKGQTAKKEVKNVRRKKQSKKGSSSK